MNGIHVVLHTEYSSLSEWTNISNAKTLLRLVEVAVAQFLTSWLHSIIRPKMISVMLGLIHYTQAKES